MPVMYSKTLLEKKLKNFPSQKAKREIKVLEQKLKGLNVKKKINYVEIFKTMF